MLTVVGNLKGGTGKSTVAFNLAVWLAHEQPGVMAFDFDPQGFEWIDCDNTDQSTLAYLRRSEDETIIVVFNFTPVIREDYRIGVPLNGQYEEILNSDSSYYEGSNKGNAAPIYSDDTPAMNRPHSLSLTLPPLASVILRYTN